MEQISPAHHSINQASSNVLATYSVSFCDKFANDRTCTVDYSDDEDETRDDACLLDDKRLKNSVSSTSVPGVGISIPKPVKTIKTCKRGNTICCQCHSKYTYTCPVSASAPEFDNSDTIVYGAALQSDNVSNGKDNGSITSSTTHRVIYCVHGKASGCCPSLTGAPSKNGSMPPDGGPASPLPSDTITIYDEHYCHNEERTTTNTKARKKLIIASILCIIFMIGEIIGGYLSSSLAIATDAAHLLTDFASFMISLFALWVANRPPTQSMPFGWYRAEVIGALTSVLMIWIVTGILVYMAEMT